MVLEIGFGLGEAALALALAEPGRDLLAVDVHAPGAGALLRDAAAHGLTNLRIVLGDAVPVLRDLIGPGALDEVRVFFPDPWPKSRHHKRRLVTPGFVRLVASRLAGGGHLYLATDWVDYAAEMLAAIDGEPLLDNPFGTFAPRPAWRPVTRFEQRGLDAGRRVVDIVAERRAEEVAAPGALGEGVVEVVAAALVDDLSRPRRLLAARRTEPAWAAGRWEFPGGKREHGEDAVVALRRELVEELGVEVEVGGEILCPATGSAWPIRPGYVMRVWWAQVASGEPRPLEDHDELRWLDVAGADGWLDVPWLDADVPIVEQLRRVAR